MATQTMPRQDVGGRTLSLAPPGFVGRERELAALTEALGRPPAVVLVEGEAGIGKSRLINEALRTPSVARLRVLEGACPPVREGFTLGPVVDAVRQATNSPRDLELSALAGALRPLFPEWAEDLPPAPDPVEDATAARHRMFRALAELLDALHVNVLVVEDVHWADDATMEFLLFLASRRPQRLSLIVTYRPEDVSSGSLVARLGSGQPAGTTRLRLTLAPLSLADTAQLVSSMLAGDSVSDEFVRYLHERSDGLPLAVEELMRLLADRVDIVHREGGWMRRHLHDISVPPTIRDAVLERFERLSSDTQAILQAAAVLVEPAGEAMLRQVARLGAVRARTALTRALESRLLVENPDDSLAFRHALARQAIYDAIPAMQRRVLHARAAQILEVQTPLPVARLAHHYRHADDSERWQRYGERAAHLALTAGDEAAAAELLYDLVVHAGLPPSDIARLTNKIPLMSLDGRARRYQLVRTLRSALGSTRTRGGGGDEEANLRCQLGRVLISTNDWNAAHVELEQAVPYLQHDPVAAARTMTLLAWPLGSERPVADHLRWLHHAAELTIESSPADELLVLVNRIYALLMLGEEEGWAEADRVPDDPSPGLDRLRVAFGSVNIAEAAMHWGRYSDARHWLTRAMRLAETGELRHVHDDALVDAAHLDYLTGAWKGLAARTELIAKETVVDSRIRLRATLINALLEVAAGAWDGANEHLTLVLDDGRRRGVADYVEPAAALARLLLARGHVEDALEVTDEPIRIMATKATWVWASDIAPIRVETLLAAERFDKAVELTRRFGRGLRNRNAAAPKNALLLCRAMLAQSADEYSRAAELFARAAKAWQALPRPYDALLARERQARCLLAEGDDDEALSLLGEVLRGLAQLGASNDTDRVAHLLRQHGRTVPRVWRGGRRGYGDQLSPRELEVARLVAVGMTNKEVARELVRAPSTVAEQVKAAMRKLGVSSRTALAVRLVEAGGEPPGPLRNHPVVGEL